MLILLKDRIDFFQCKIQSVDITPDQENADIFKLIVSIYNQFLFNVVFRQVL